MSEFHLLEILSEFRQKYQFFTDTFWSNHLNVLCELGLWQTRSKTGVSVAPHIGCALFPHEGLWQSILLLLDTTLRCQSVTNWEFPRDTQRQLALFTFGKYGDSPPEEGTWLVAMKKSEKYRKTNQLKNRESKRKQQQRKEAN